MAIISFLKNIKNKVKSITFDRGSEFNKYQWIKDCLECSMYFCDPGAPEQKGAIENANGVIRCELPRCTNIDEYAQKDITAIVDEINDRPMKCLDFNSPQEMFNKEF